MCAVEILKGSQVMKKEEKLENKSVTDLSRRRLTKAGLIASPFLASIPGKSALAGNCDTLSGMLSGNLSAPNATFQPCDGAINHLNGLSPGYWRTVCQNNPAFPGAFNERSKVSDLSYSGVPMNVPTGLLQFTVLELLWLKSSQTNVAWPIVDLTHHCIAALFSSLEFNDYFLSPGQIVTIYNDLIAVGFYVDPNTNKRVYPDNTEGVERNFIEIIKSSYVGQLGVVDVIGDCDGANFIYDESSGYFYILESDGKHVRYNTATDDREIFGVSYN